MMMEGFRWTMANLTKEIKVYNDGSYEVQNISIPPQLPEPVEFPGTKIIDETENGQWARIRHDGDGNGPAPRIEGSNNNEVNVHRTTTADGTKIDRYTKISMKVGEEPLLRLFKLLFGNILNLGVKSLRLDWEDYFKSFMTEWTWQRFTAKGYWCYDTGYPTFNLLDAGGNDVHVLEITSDNWARIEHQDYNAGPNYALNPYEHRWLFTKQWMTGGTHEEPHWVLDKGYVGGLGDINVPKVSPVDVYTSTWRPPDDGPQPRPGQQGLEFWPDLPLKGELDGVPCTITKYGLYKTDTYGYVEGKGWYILEEMVVSGDPNDYAVGGTWKDRVVHFSPWLKSHPPTYIGWIRPN